MLPHFFCINTVFNYYKINLKKISVDLSNSKNEHFGRLWSPFSSFFIQIINVTQKIKLLGCWCRCCPLSCFVSSPCLVIDVDFFDKTHVSRSPAQLIHSFSWIDDPNRKKADVIACWPLQSLTNRCPIWMARYYRLLYTRFFPCDLELWPLPLSVLRMSGCRSERPGCKLQ